MLSEVPVLLHNGGHRPIICMAGGNQQHSAEGIPIRLVGVIGFLIIFRPGGVGGLARLRNGAQDLIPPVLHRRLDLCRGHFFLVISRFSIRRDPVKGVSVFLRPLLNNSFPVVRIVPGQCSGVNIKSHGNTSLKVPRKVSLHFHSRKSASPAICPSSPAVCCLQSVQSRHAISPKSSEMYPANSSFSDFS